jgi:hypothetical protein
VTEPTPEPVVESPRAEAAPRTPVFVRLLFLVALAFTFIGVIESLFIGYDLATHGSLSVFRAPDLERGIRSWTEHHSMRPGYEDSVTRLNSFGLRSPEVAVPKPAGTPRVLLLGDSFTFGFKAVDKDVFGRLLEGDLRRLDGREKTEVVNAGVVSYCPLLEYLQYRHHLHVLEPDLVILSFDMSDVQDTMDYSRFLERAADGTPLFVTEKSLGTRATAWPALLSFQWVERKVTAVMTRFQAAKADSPFVRDLDRYVWTLDKGKDWTTEARAAMAPIADLARLLRHHNIPLVLATYPQPWQVSASATPKGGIRAQYGIGENSVHLNDRPFRMLEQFAAENNLPFVNATEAFRVDASPDTLFLETDFHFSPRGNALYAEVLRKFVVARGLGVSSATGRAPDETLVPASALPR